MRALVVYESMFGNTAAVARAIAEGIQEAMPVDVREVADAPLDVVDQVDLLVAGGPTHALSMSRPRTRAEAFAQGGTSGKVDVGLREWIRRVPAGDHAASLVTFDTKMSRARRWPGSAAKSAAKAGRRHGVSVADAPKSFYVTDTAGPLVDGEIERATAWGRALGALVRTP
ncbi:MAG: hypothetical protein JWR27_2920 [Aeromicrobium sp.]|jgi:hypothetical protein|nr:hypothetical protein [Aeromicrobium sp.]